MKQISTLFLGFCLLGLTHCASQQINSLSLGKYDNPRANKVEPEAKVTFLQAEKYFFEKNFDKALPLYQNIKNKFPNGKAVQLASYRIGSIFYYQKDYNSASKEFEYFLGKFPRSEITFDVTYNWAAAEFQQEKAEKANEVLSRLKLPDVYAQGPKRAEIVFQLAAQVSTAMGNNSGAALAYLAELQIPLSEFTREKLEVSIAKSINAIQNTNELNRLLTQVKEERFRDRINNRIAVLGLQAEPQITQNIGLPTPPPLSQEPILKNQNLISGTVGERSTVGIVLPLTGKFSSYGKKALDAILLAAKSYSPFKDTNLQLVVEDSRSNPILAAHAVEKLVNEDHAMAIIGPLSWKESLFAADKAQELGVLNISLSSKDGIADRGVYIFQNALTPKLQLESLVSHCIKNLKISRFALLVPNNNFGNEYSSYFWNAVTRLGGKVMAFDSYNPDEKDFQKNVQELVGLNPKYRRLEFSKLLEYQKDQKAKTGKDPKVKLEPIIDFEAIFIPDSPKIVAQIAASLAYYDIKDITLLGTTEWNSDQLYQRGGQYVAGALFPGGLSPSSQNPTQVSFIKSYHDAYGTNPDLLASQAYEAMHIVISALRTASSSDRNELVTFINNQKTFSSPLGSDVSFDGTRVAKRTVPIFKLESNGAVVQQ
ncbi:MAG: penicillin-binding protein activator [Bdellovibrionales bacterium]|nr:penicillin-binding protein activator [Bdellovibrionales bacterium]